MSKLIGVKLRKSPRNIYYSKFLPGSIKLFNMHRGVKKLKLFSVRIGFTGQVFTAEVYGVDSALALRQGLSNCIYKPVLSCTLNFMILSNGNPQSHFKIKNKGKSLSSNYRYYFHTNALQILS